MTLGDMIKVFNQLVETDGINEETEVLMAYGGIDGIHAINDVLVKESKSALDSVPSTIEVVIDG